MLNRLIFFSLLILPLASCGPNNEATEHSEASLPKGLITDSAMVVSAHPLASKVGKEILQKGGNAVDAAVAVQFALAVVYPEAGNIGGGGFMIYRGADGKTSALDYREAAPIAATKDMYLDENKNIIPDKSTLGHAAVGVPGSVDGMVSAYEKYGSLPWHELVQPAIDLAKNGFELTEKEANGLNMHYDHFISQNEHIKNRFSNKNKAGDTVKYPELARTLELIRDNKRAGFYQGATADLIVKEMERGNGIITLEDLENYHSIWRTPVTGKYNGYKIISMPPPSSGGIALMQMLTMLNSCPLDELGFHTAKSIHYITEVERRVYADRATHLGDPDFYLVPQDSLLDSTYLAKRFSSISAEKATSSDSINAGTFKLPESEQTTHFSIVDKYGNAVSITTTLNGAYGSKVVVDGAGFFLNNEMDDFSSKPGTPNMFGLIGGEANAIAPLKRMLSSMTPTIIEKDNQLYMVVGTPGGSTIITSVLQTILNVTEYNMTMQQAVDASRFHHQWYPDSIIIEPNALSAEVMKELEDMGHHFKLRESTIGRVDAILVKDNQLEGGADHRGDDTADGF